MSRFLKLLAGVLFVAGAVFAQETAPTPPATPAPQQHKKHGDAAEKRLKRASKRLNLTDDQKEKIGPIFQDEEKQMTEVQGDSTLTTEQKRKKTRQIRLASRSQVDAILTPEQKEKMPPVRAHGGGRHHMKAGKPNSGTTTDDSDQQ